MSRSYTGIPPTLLAQAAAVAYGCLKFTRRLILSILLVSLLSVFSQQSYTAEAKTAATISNGAVQNPSGAWSCRGVYHVVGRGETIYRIARRYGTTAYRIAVCNGLASYTVYVGQTLLVPTAQLTRRSGGN
jgi:membrane-bound lytic murein transglycosylase D